MKNRLDFRFLVLLISGFVFYQPCHAAPSEYFLKSLSHHALDLSSHHPLDDEHWVPEILTPDERSEEFKKLLRLVLTDISKSGESRAFKDEDNLLLSNCLSSKNPLFDKNCDPEIIKIGELLLFHQPKSENLIKTDNPSFLAIKRDYPHAKLKHDTTLEGLKDILKTGSIGPLDPNLSKDVEDTFIKTMVDCRQQKNLDVSQFGKNLSLFDFLERYSSTPAKNRGIVWTSILRDVSDMAKLPIYGKHGGTPGIRLVLKNDLLKRWDYHINKSWNSNHPLNFGRIHEALQDRR